MQRQVLGLLLLFATACGAEPRVTPTATEMVVQVAPSATAQPTHTAVPTAAATPTSEAPTSTPTPEPASPTPEPTATATASPTAAPTAVSFAGGALPKAKHTWFSGSGSCNLCHNNQVDDAGQDVSITDSWRASSMANSARDPYWQASVSAEIDTFPELAAVIEDTCANCHMPMARFTDVARGNAIPPLEEGYFNDEHELHNLAMDGVSCTVCHQIEADNFGEMASFGGGYLIDETIPAGERVSYGRFEVSEADAEEMQRASGFIPAQSPHIEASALCATCHVLYTPTLDANGEVVGMFPEQTVYLEWEQSDYADTQGCLDCHMPVADGEVAIASSIDRARSPFFQHSFVGGNAYILRQFQQFGPELGVTASSDDFATALARIEALLQRETAELSIDSIQLEGNQLTAVVTINSLTGHKFPSSYPSRRAWLHLAVRDGYDNVVFESGAVGADGAIAGNDNDVDGSAYESHYTTISSPDQVQIYELIFVDTAGDVTTTLLHAARIVKDNRLLPAGFDKANVPPDVAAHGTAADDNDFADGGDSITYAVDVGGAAGPFTVTAELLYQSIGYRWAMNLGHHETPAVATFLEYYAAVPNWPVVVATAEAAP